MDRPHEAETAMEAMLRIGAHAAAGKPIIIGVEHPLAIGFMGPFYSGDHEIQQVRIVREATEEEYLRCWDLDEAFGDYFYEVAAVD